MKFDLWNFLSFCERNGVLNLVEGLLHNNFFVAVLVLVHDNSRVRLGFTCPRHQYQGLLLKAHPALVQGFRLCLDH